MTDEAGCTRRWLINASGAAILSGAMPVANSIAQTAGAPVSRAGRGEDAISPAAIYVETLLEQDQTLNPRARERLTIVQQAIAAVVQTVARLREFSRPRESQAARERVDLNDVVQQSVALTRARWQNMPHGKGIEVRTELDLAGALHPIMGSASEIRDAVVNLMTGQARVAYDPARVAVHDLVSAVEALCQHRTFFSSKMVASRTCCVVRRSRMLAARPATRARTAR